MKRDKNEDLLFPVDFIAPGEECIPGEGTYEEDGNIFSSVMGELRLN